MTATSNELSPHPGLSFAAFVTMMAAFMALNGLAVDTMLPALPAIGEELGVVADNDRQWIITAYLLGFGFFQIFYGPLSDSYGRRPVLLFGVSLYAVFSLLSVFAYSFDLVVFTRFMQGAGSAASRVMVVAIVRDCYSGRQMARVMSLALIIFLIVPVFAPALGQAVMLFVSWHWIFLGLSLFACVLVVWAWLYLPETLRPENRLPLVPARVIKAFGVVANNRISMGYCMATLLVMGPLYGYLGSVQQIFADVYDVPALFAVYFAITALSVAVASLLNARIVERFGTRLVSHSALCLLLLVAVIGLLTALSGHQGVIAFIVLQSALMFCFGLTAPNFSAMAMEPVGHIAGTASSVQGFVTTIGAAVLGFVIGQAFDGTTVPLFAGFVLLNAGAIVVLYFTEGKLFRPTEQVST